MPDYYNSIDIYLCASDVEGTPNPVLEAMACGVPIISTDVGIVQEVFGPLQAEYIVERDIGAFKAKIRDLVKHPEKRLRLSQENLTSIQGWDWSEKIIAWGEFFQTILNTYPAKAADISMWGFNYQDIRRQLITRTSPTGIEGNGGRRAKAKKCLALGRSRHFFAGIICFTQLSLLSNFRSSEEIKSLEIAGLAGRQTFAELAEKRD